MQCLETLEELHSCNSPVLMLRLCDQCGNSSNYYYRYDGSVEQRIAIEESEIPQGWHWQSIRSLPVNQKYFQCQCGEIEPCDIYTDSNNIHCFTCAFWIKQIAVPGGIIIDGEHYRLGKNSGPFRGFGGAHFRIKLASGEIIDTNDLWYQGKIPPALREKMPNNARFITQGMTNDTCAAVSNN